MILFCLLSSHFAFAGDKTTGDKTIGKIKNLTNDVKVLRYGKEFIPVLGTALFNKDTLKTGSNGTMGILLTDDTIFSLGPDSELNLDTFYFDLPNKKFSLAARMIKGTFIFISGLMGKISPESIELSTPDGIVAIRGTKIAIQIKGKK